LSPMSFSLFLLYSFFFTISSTLEVDYENKDICWFVRLTWLIWGTVTPQCKHNNGGHNSYAYIAVCFLSK
jgi:hypothetical protein